MGLLDGGKVDEESGGVVMKGAVENDDVLAIKRASSQGEKGKGKVEIKEVVGSDADFDVVLECEGL